MGTKYFANDNQLKEWVSASEVIDDRFGIEKALGYLIGEKFYDLIQLSLRLTKNLNKLKESNEMYYRNKEIISELNIILPEFADLIKNVFDDYKIKKYLNSNPRFGALGHVADEEEHRLFVEKGAVEHSIDTEIEDTMILGKLMEYFGGSEKYL